MTYGICNLIKNISKFKKSLVYQATSLKAYIQQLPFEPLTTNQRFDQILGLSTRQQRQIHTNYFTNFNVLIIHLINLLTLFNVLLNVLLKFAMSYHLNIMWYFPSMFLKKDINIVFYSVREVWCCFPVYAAEKCSLMIYLTFSHTSWVNEVNHSACSNLSQRWTVLHFFADRHKLFTSLSLALHFLCFHCHQRMPLCWGFDINLIKLK